MAIKCPSIDLHLVTFKKFQEILSETEILNQFLPPPNREILDFLGGFWSLKERERDEEIKDIISSAIKNPEDYVLKTHREGGGNNYFGEEMKEQLGREVNSELDNMFLMKKIKPKVTSTYFLKNGEAVPVDSVCEFSVFGVMLSTPKGVMQNTQAGYLMRTKVYIYIIYIYIYIYIGSRCWGRWCGQWICSNRYSIFKFTIANSNIWKNGCE